jgi:hypothetical protein
MTAPAPNEYVLDKRPRMAYGGSIQVTSGTAISPQCMMFIINITTATTVSFTTADGNTVSLGTVPIGIYQWDVQAVEVTLGTPADGTIAGFYNP